MIWKIDWKLFAFLALGFVAATIIGTLSHEFGHFAVAEALGYDSSIHYGYTSYDGDKPVVYPDYIWVTMGGPLQTMLTGTIGLSALLLALKKYRDSEKLDFWKWFWIFICLFWLRQTANFATALPAIMNGRINRSRADELRLDLYFGLPRPTVMTITAAIGCAVLAFVVFRVIPLEQRLTFLLSGLVGGILGYVFWLGFFGKYILP